MILRNVELDSLLNNGIFECHLNCNGGKFVVNFCQALSFAVTIYLLLI